MTPRSYRGERGHKRDVRVNALNSANVQTTLRGAHSHAAVPDSGRLLDSTPPSNPSACARPRGMLP